MQLHARAELGRGGGESSELLEQNTHTRFLWQTSPYTHTHTLPLPDRCTHSLTTHTHTHVQHAQTTDFYGRYLENDTMTETNFIPVLEETRTYSIPLLVHTHTHTHTHTQRQTHSDSVQTLTP